jgi:hypothetical protein
VRTIPYVKQILNVSMMPVLLVLEVKPEHRHQALAVVLPPTLQLLDRLVHLQLELLFVLLIFIVPLTSVSIVLQILQEQLLNPVLQMKPALFVELVLEISTTLQELIVFLLVEVKQKIFNLLNLFFISYWK